MIQPLWPLRMKAQKLSLIREIVQNAPSDAIHLGLGQPDWKPDPKLLESLGKIFSQKARYSPNAGLEALRVQIAQYYPETEPEQIIVTHGSEQAIFLAMSGLLDEKSEVLIPDPSFPVYESIARLYGARIKYYPLYTPSKDAFLLNPEVILKVLTPNTRLVVFNFPHNPTGLMPSRKVLKKILEVLSQKGILYLSDEVYGSLIFEADRALPSALSPDGLVADSLSKRVGLMGWRLGWLRVPKSFSKPLIALQQLMITCATVPIQHLALSIFKRRTFYENPLSNAILERRDKALQTLLQWSLRRKVLSYGALYLWLDVRQYFQGHDLELAKFLSRRGVIVIPGRAFGSGGKGFLRLSFGGSITDFQRGVEKMARALLSLESRSISS